MSVVNEEVTLTVLEDTFYNEEIGKIAKVTVQEKLREGAHGVVHRALSITDNKSQEFAIEIFKETVDIDDEHERYQSFLRSFQREFEASQRLRHDNVARIYQFGYCDCKHFPKPRCYLLSELVTGKELDKCNLSEMNLHEIMKQCAQGLGAIHGSGAVHADIKLDNIVIREDAIVKILDFGICYAMRASSYMSRKVSADPERENLVYLGPELWREGRKTWQIHLDEDPNIKGLYIRIPASDVFALGVCFYKLSTGKFPYGEEHEVARNLQRILFEVKPPIQLNPDIPYMWNAVIMKCLQRTLGRRFADANAILQGIGEPLENLATAKIADTKLADDFELLGRRISDGKLDLSYSNVQDNDLQILKDISYLKRLYLGHTAISDAGLEHLKNMPHLKRLYLEHTAISDAGLEHLENIVDLAQLNLGHTAVSDAGLEHIKNMVDLTMLGLMNTQISDAGKKELKAALPDCKILY